MSIVKKMAYLLAGIGMCAAMLYGCSDNKEVKPAKKTESVQAQTAKEAAQEIRKPIEAAQNARDQVEAKGKKQLEGC